MKDLIVYAICEDIKELCEPNSSDMFFFIHESHKLLTKKYTPHQYLYSREFYPNYTDKEFYESGVFDHEFFIKTLSLISKKPSSFVEFRNIDQLREVMKHTCFTLCLLEDNEELIFNKQYYILKTNIINVLTATQKNSRSYNIPNGSYIREMILTEKKGQ